MQIKNKEITVLLGHNGAGKTTILNMIIGIVPKDSGKIVVCSERNVFSYRHLVGYCPQRSIFMHYMTCKQHLNFFAQLRGMSEQEAHKISEIHLKQLQLLDKQDEYGKNLSGGMKRRLSLGIAMTGETKVIVLDEPSSGLDIESRRNLWDILLDLRKTTAILVTTHHMEEAEILGDKICILGNGRLQHTGSPLELKRKFGNGYVLKLRVNKQHFNETETLNLLRPTLESVSIINSNPPTVLIRLPYQSRHKYNLALQMLEKKRKFLGIQYISISDASLEDVFLSCEAQGDSVDSTILMHDEKDSVPYKHLYEKSISISQQLMAVFYMKLIYLYNNWMYTLLMFCLPFVSIGFALLVMNSISAADNENALNLNLRQINKGVIVVSNRIDDINDRSELKTLLVKDIENSGSIARNLNLPPTKSLSGEIIRMQENDLSYFLQNIIGAIELTATRSGAIKVNIYFSGNIYHSSVILMNLVDNAILKLNTNQSHNIESVYIPMKRVLNDLSPSRLEYYAVIVPIGLFFYVFFYVSLPFKENNTQFKNLQPSPCLIYWFAVMTFDFLQHLIVCLLLCIFQAAIMPAGFYSITEQYTIMMSILFYGFSYIPILYFFATACLSISTLTTYLLLMLVTSAILPLITSGSVQAMIEYEVAILFFSLLPDFNLNHQLRQINENFLIYRRNLLLDNKTEDYATYNKTQYLNVGVYFLYATIVPCVVMAVFIYFWENKERHQRIGNLFNCNKCRHLTKLNGQVCTTTTADDETLVASEKALVKDVISKGNENDYALLVCELKKLFSNKTAVRELSFAVRRRECFGLLGVNGAGKTTTFEMLTANQTISGGSASIAGINITTNENQYKHLFGYCPQNDALHNFMTSYQILKYIALMRGIERSQVHREVEYWLMSLHLWRYKNVKIENYSGGTKRKLNVAIAMIGSPEIIFLDEPTTGIDPVSRRFLWNCVREFQQRDKTVVLTSHSMDECEQLCTRLALMSDGDLKCIGCIPDLKQHYGTGFSVVIKTACASSENIKAITSQLRNHFSNVTFRECHAGFLTFFVEDSGEIMWSNVFNKMELLTSDCGYLIQDYSVNEAKLEDIILNLRQS